MNIYQTNEKLIYFTKKQNIFIKNKYEYIYIANKE